jgi:SAM-dependent methyltransferase
MTREESIIELAQWLHSPPGRYLLAWEQAQVDRTVSDLFGFHALQLGLGPLDALRANRMPHRWLASDSLLPSPRIELPPADAALSTLPSGDAIALHCEFDALPFPSQSLDLVVLPHALEMARDPHDTLREVERVLLPEGRVVIIGLNPTSLWGLRQSVGRLRRRIGLGERLYLPRSGDFIGYWRARDWLRLLGFEVERARFGCWRPPVNSALWLERLGWMDRWGERWWPVFGAVYFLVAVKRVRGMRLVGLARRRGAATKAAPAVVRHSQFETTEQD